MKVLERNKLKINKSIGRDEVTYVIGLGSKVKLVKNFRFRYVRGSGEG